MTVAEFRIKLMQDAGLKSHTSFETYSLKHAIFWQKLNDIGARNITSHPPNIHRDIDKTVTLSVKEQTQLRREFVTLISSSSL